MNIESIIPIVISLGSLLVSYLNRRDKVFIELREESKELRETVEDLKTDHKVLVERVANSGHLYDRLYDKIDNLGKDQ